MRKRLTLISAVVLLTSCSPRDVLSRRLAADLIQLSDTFRSQQSLRVQTGIVSSKDYLAPETLVLQHHGWISAATTACPAGLAPPPCWDILLTPSGVETVRTLISEQEATKPTFAIPVARREMVAITGVSKQGSVAQVEFTWKWIPLNEIGAALYSSDQRYRSTVGFRDYDDGWRIIESGPSSNLPLEEALRTAELAE
ncbi:MAG TPA: hypothetical protein VKV39_14425 [Candidatus Sulfotelmatobacter sp.]|nr:hypothetical protein [Candidatus Sulfotelmatobacter sp.]